MLQHCFQIEGTVQYSTYILVYCILNVDIIGPHPAAVSSFLLTPEPHQPTNNSFCSMMFVLIRMYKKKIRLVAANALEEWAFEPAPPVAHVTYCTKRKGKEIEKLFNNY